MMGRSPLGADSRTKTELGASPEDTYAAPGVMHNGFQQTSSGWLHPTRLFWTEGGGYARVVAAEQQNK